MRNMKMVALIAICVSQLLFFKSVSAQKSKKAIISYYSGSLEGLDNIDPLKMTHIIYCFGHLSGNNFHIGSAKDTLMIQKMVGLKKKNPDLKVLLSLGGWGGCETCSDAFGTKKGRNEFASSVKKMNDFMGTDGIDLDWEYPTIPGPPGHKYSPADKENFTSLVKQLRNTLGARHTITFAAGGFQKFLDESVDWKNVMKYVDYVNLMTYDLVHGYSTKTGHHTPLYSTPEQKESTDNCVQDLIRKGVDRKKLIVGAAFYARTWENVADVNNGRYQEGKFKSFIAFKDFEKSLSGFETYWDDVAKSPYAYNSSEKIYATFDNQKSIAIKSKYVMDQDLGGIMFWELSLDKNTADGLLNTINNTMAQ